MLLTPWDEYASVTHYSTECVDDNDASKTPMSRYAVARPPFTRLAQVNVLLTVLFLLRLSGVTPSTSLFVVFISRTTNERTRLPLGHYQSKSLRAPATFKDKFVIRFRTNKRNGHFAISTKRLSSFAFGQIIIAIFDLRFLFEYSRAVENDVQCEFGERNVVG